MPSLIASRTFSTLKGVWYRSLTSILQAKLLIARHMNVSSMAPTVNAAGLPAGFGRSGLNLTMSFSDRNAGST